MEAYKIIQLAARWRWHTTESQFDKETLVTHFREMSEHEVNEFCREILKLQHHKDTTVGLWATDKDPCNALTEFWQREVDACPLEATEAEEQETQFHDYAIDRFFKIKY